MNLSHRSILLAVLGSTLLGGALLHGQNSPAAGAPSRETTNLARGFSGAGAFLWDERSSSFVSYAGLGAVIDDDVASGWTPPTGKTTVLVQLAQDAELSAVTLYAPGAVGRYSVSIAENAEAVSAGRLTRIASNLDLSAIDQKAGLASGAAKYLVIELDVAKSAPLRGVQALGVPLTAPSTAISVVAPKAGAEDNEAKDQGEVAEVNFALKAVGGSTPGNPDEASALIDGDTATASRLPPDTRDTIIHLASAVEIDRVALAVGQAVGRVTIFVSDGNGQDVREIGVVKLDGKAEAVSLDAPGIRAEFVRLQWTPAEGGGDLVVKEVGVFAQARISRREPPPGSAAVVVQVMPVFNSATPSLPSATSVSRTQPGTPPAPPVEVPTLRAASL